MVNLDYERPYTEEDSKRLNAQLEEWKKELHEDSHFLCDFSQVTPLFQGVLNLILNAKDHKQIGSLTWDLAEYTMNNLRRI